MKTSSLLRLSRSAFRNVILGLSTTLTITAFGAFGLLFSPSASALEGTMYQVSLSQLNKSNVSGTATVAVDGSNITVTIRATGLSPNRAHGAHIHIGGQAACPAASADTNKDGYVDNNEAKPFMGDLRVSLTTSGDTSANSALAFNRMPVADKDGNVSYSRSFALPAGVKVTDLSKATIDLQGIATLFGNKQIYDGDKRSELTNDHAFETTVPAACGALSTSPTGGAATGTGSISDIESPQFFLVGAIALAGALTAGIVARKQFTNN